jgi:hypothetical protein
MSSGGPGRVPSELAKEEDIGKTTTIGIIY